MSNPTLINGFEDVLTFISQQGDRIKNLEKDKATLVRENVELGEELEEETKRLRHQQQRLEEELHLLEQAVNQKRNEKKERLKGIFVGLTQAQHEERLNDIPQWVKNLSEEEKKKRLEKQKEAHK